MIETLLIILNLVILEGLLSVDNAAALALIVKKLPEKDQPKALKWGMWGAFILRGVCLLTAVWLAKIMWLKILGGLYLIRLCYTGFTKEEDSPEETTDASKKGLYRLASKIGMSQLWATIVVVEWVDLVFSMDNVFAAVALSEDTWVVITGVCIGIATMRLVAVMFLKLMKKYPSLEVSANIVIGLLGLKLAISGIIHYLPLQAIEAVMDAHWFDMVFSGAMMLIFFLPLLKKAKPVEVTESSELVVRDEFVQ